MSASNDSALSAILPLMPTGSTISDAQAILEALGGLTEACGQTKTCGLEDLGGTAELAEDTGLSKQSISNYYFAARKGENDFPLPLMVLKATPVWSRSEVTAWWATRS